MFFEINSPITKKTQEDLVGVYDSGRTLDYLLLNSPGGDFIAAHAIVCKILTCQPDLPIIVRYRAFSAAAYIFLCLGNRYHFKGASIFLHSIKTNIYSKDIHLLLHKRRYYSRVLRERVSHEFDITTQTANKWLREGKALTDSDLTMLLDSIKIKQIEEIFT